MSITYTDQEMSNENYVSGTEFETMERVNLPLGSQFEVVDPIHEEDVDSDIKGKLTAVSNALPKPTNQTTGTEGQILVLGANGTTEWKDNEPYYDHQISSAIKIDNAACTLMVKIPSTKSTAYATLAELPVTRMQHIPASLLVTDTDGNSYWSSIVADYYADKIYVSGVYIKSDGTVAALVNTQVTITTEIETDTIIKI